MEFQRRRDDSEDYVWMLVSRLRAAAAAAHTRPPPLQDSTLYIDPTRFGNQMRLVNHSCFPSVVAIKMLRKHRDKKRPLIGFFAVRLCAPWL